MSHGYAGWIGNLVLIWLLMFNIRLAKSRWCALVQMEFRWALPQNYVFFNENMLYKQISISKCELYENLVNRNLTLCKFVKKVKYMILICLLNFPNN